MTASPQPPKLLLTGGLTVIVTTLVPGLVLAFAQAYLNSDPTAAYQREEIFHAALFLIGTQTLTNLLGFLLTYPVYLWFRLPRIRRRLILHATAATLLSTAIQYLGLPAHLHILLPPGTLSDSGHAEFLLLTTLAATFPYLLLILLQSALRRET